jgi:RNA polymerase-binding transcription factor DksA
LLSGILKDTTRNGGIDMECNMKEIYLELRKTKEELLQRLENENCSSLAKPYIEGELADIETALQKMEYGTYGTCEISGEILPEHLLSIVPTLRSMDDCKMMSYFLKKLY